MTRMRRAPVPDLHHVSLDPACEGLLYPSKVYGIRAAGRPLLWLRPGLGIEDLRKAAAGPVDVTSSRRSAGVEAWVSQRAECASTRAIAAGAQGEQPA